MVLTLFDLLQGTKTAGGTWSHSGSGPAAPGTYDGTVDFSGASDGTYVYEYEVTEGSCTHTSQLRITVNSNCSGCGYDVFFVVSLTLTNVLNTNALQVEMFWEMLNLPGGATIDGTITLKNQSLSPGQDHIENVTTATGTTTAIFDYSPNQYQQDDYDVDVSITINEECTCTDSVGSLSLGTGVGYAVRGSVTLNCQ